MMLLSRFEMIPLIGAVALHGIVAGIAMQPEPPVAIPQNQIIQISMVAPTIVKEKKAEPEPVLKKKSKPALPPQKKGMVKLQETPEQKPEPPQKAEAKTPARDEAQDKVQMQQLTSGLTSPDAMQMASAVTKPVAASYLNNPPPRYPEKARLRKQQGTVLLDVRVKTDGKPRGIRVAKSSGHHSLDQAALQTVRLWEFVPARRGSKHVEANVEIPITFRIN
jgi:protein TonB